MVLLLPALAAQFALDFLVAALRDAIARGTTISEQLGYVWVYGIDAAFAIVGFAFAREVDHAPALVLGLNRAYRGTALALGWNAMRTDRPLSTIRNTA